MSLKRTFILAALLLAALVLAACELSASTPPPQTTSDEAAVNRLQTQLAVIATQTEMARNNNGAQPTAVTQPGETSPVVNTPAPTPTLPAGPSEPTAVATEEPTDAPEPTRTPAPEFEPTPGLPETYQLHFGEHPYCIARRFNLDVGELLTLNGLGANTVLPEGYTLKIPQSGNTYDGDRSLVDHPTTYTASANETAYSIACQFGDVYPEAIVLANGLDGPRDIDAGDELYIP